jgi:hypothetical protein
LFASCAGKPGRRILNLPNTPGVTGAAGPYIITDYKNMAAGRNIPEWVSLCLEGDIREVETLDAYEGRYVFIRRNEGNNFNALAHWVDGFSLELDFPRLAASRIETRFSTAAPFPDHEYGAFFETLIRTASDAIWTGAVREGDFWIRRKFLPNENEVEPPARAENQTLTERAFDELAFDEQEFDEQMFDEQALDETEPPQEREDWEFFILVTIEKTLFASQLEAVFRNVKPNPAPAREQTTAVNRVKDRFYDGF